MGTMKSSTIEILIFLASSLAYVYSKTPGVVPQDARDINVPVAKQCLKDNGLDEGILDIIIRKDLRGAQNLNLTKEDEICSYACHAKFQLDKYIAQIPEEVKSEFTKNEKSDLLNTHVECKTKESSYCRYAVCLYKEFLTFDVDTTVKKQGGAMLMRGGIRQWKIMA